MWEMYDMDQKGHRAKKQVGKRTNGREIEKQQVRVIDKEKEEANEIKKLRNRERER